MYIITSFLAVLSSLMLGILIYGRVSEKNGKMSAAIDMRKVQDRRESIAKLIESKPVETDSDSVADAWSELSQ